MKRISVALTVWYAIASIHVVVVAKNLGGPRGKDRRQEQQERHLNVFKRPPRRMAPVG